MMHPITPHTINAESITSKIPEILTWMEQLGLSTLSSRYSKYNAHIDHFFNAENPANEDGRYKFEILTKSYIEILNIFNIYNSFKNESSKGFIKRLTKANSGIEHLTESPIAESRDFLFELLIASEFKNLNYQIDFDKDTDVIGSRDGQIVHSECKRLSSTSSLERNFKKAGNQITQRLANQPISTYGLIFIDISKCIENERPHHELSSAIEAQLRINLAFKNFINNNSSIIETLNKKFIKDSLGVCLRAQWPVWTKDLELFSVNKIDIRASECLDDEKFNILNNIFTPRPPRQTINIIKK